jgi:hypothetical protein
MSSQALIDFRERLKDVQQLLDAHGALTALRNAQAEAELGAGLASVGRIVEHLVSAPGPGRPRQVQALNSAAIALLSAHLQGFLADLYDEVAKATLDGKVKDLSALTNSARMRGNPNEQNITRLFSSIGYSDVLDGISWQGLNNNELRKKLRAFNELRNKIVHGSRHTTKSSGITSRFLACSPRSWM